MKREEVAAGALAVMLIDMVAALAFWSSLFNYLYDVERIAASLPFAAVGIVAFFVFVLAAGTVRDAA